MIMLEFECPQCGRFESLESRERDELECPYCGLDAVWVISAPKPKVQIVTAMTGGSDERPPGAMDTRGLADGMKLTEWRKQNRAKREPIRRKFIKDHS